jgi:hypothetical protein
MEVIGVHDGFYPLKGRLKNYADRIGVPFLPRGGLEELAKDSGILFTSEDVGKL